MRQLIIMRQLPAIFAKSTGLMALIWIAMPVAHAQQVGVYSGWNGSTSRSEVDVEGKVGYGLNVLGPALKCGNGLGYHTETEILTGSLPPGMIKYFGSNSLGRVGGTPTERGHYITTLQIKIYCGSNISYYTQVVRFHITGSGQVIQ